MAEGNVCGSEGWILWVLSFVFTLPPLMSFYHVRSVQYLKIMIKTSFWKMRSDDATCFETKRKCNQMEEKPRQIKE